jgi:predicted RNA-binding protein
MCEARVYLVKDDQEEQIMRDVVLLRPQEDGIFLSTLLGEQLTVRGSIERIDFLRHTVYLKETEIGAPATS